jgi:hypothetical protein
MLAARLVASTAEAAACTLDCANEKDPKPESPTTNAAAINFFISLSKRN